MRIVFALTMFVVACGGPTKKPEGAIVKEGSAVPDSCCCKSNPSTSVDGKPEYEMANRMECSTKQGECVDDIQCNGKQQPD